MTAGASQTFDAPHPSRRGSVWIVDPAPVGVYERPPISTGVYHSTVDCPTVRIWMAMPRTTLGWLRELDPTSGEGLAEWRKEADEGRWTMGPSRARFLMHAEWRACLRCGSASTPTESVTCPRCWLTACDCEK